MQSDARTIKKAANRRKKAVKNGYASEILEFLDDQEGKYGEKGNCYIRYWFNDLPFRGQVHIWQIRFEYGSNRPYRYPDDPPNVTFLTPMYHTNISTGGAVCLDVIKPEKWSAMYGIETIINSIVALMQEPNHSSPFNGKASSDCKKNTPEAYGGLAMNFYKTRLKNVDPRVIRLMQSTDFKSKMSEDALTQRDVYLAELGYKDIPMANDNNAPVEPVEVPTAETFDESSEE